MKRLARAWMDFTLVHLGLLIGYGVVSVLAPKADFGSTGMALTMTVPLLAMSHQYARRHEALPGPAFGWKLAAILAATTQGANYFVIFFVFLAQILLRAVPPGEPPVPPSWTAVGWFYAAAAFIAVGVLFPLLVSSELRGLEKRRLRARPGGEKPLEHARERDQA